MRADSAVKVWLDPWKYWSATAKMSEEETSSLIDKVMNDAEAGNLEALKQYTFVTTEDPVEAWRRRRRLKASATRLAS
jgi:hypothetical protein